MHSAHWSCHVQVRASPTLPEIIFHIRYHEEFFCDIASIYQCKPNTKCIYTDTPHQLRCPSEQKGQISVGVVQ